REPRSRSRDGGAQPIRRARVLGRPSKGVEPEQLTLRHEPSLDNNGRRHKAPPNDHHLAVDEDPAHEERPLDDQGPRYERSLDDERLLRERSLDDHDARMRRHKDRVADAVADDDDMT